MACRDAKRCTHQLLRNGGQAVNRLQHCTRLPPDSSRLAGRLLGNIVWPGAGAGRTAARMQRDGAAMCHGVLLRGSSCLQEGEKQECWLSEQLQEPRSLYRRPP